LLEQHASSLGPVSPVLVQATVHSAILIALGKALNNLVPSSVVDLMTETAVEMNRSKLRYLAVLALLALLGSSALVWGMKSLSPEKSPETAATSSCHGASSAQSKE
jgi:hypothetical protein